MLASCWVARNIFLSAANASSKARTLDSRPTTNGVIMCGKMTTSRMGIIGSFLDSNFSLIWVMNACGRDLDRHWAGPEVAPSFHYKRPDVLFGYATHGSAVSNCAKAGCERA